MNESESEGPIPFPSARIQPLIEVFFLHGHPPTVCGFYGHFHSDMIDAIEKDLEENPDFMDRGDGTYLYEARWESPQMGDEERVEIPGYWDLELVRYQPTNQMGELVGLPEDL